MTEVLVDSPGGSTMKFNVEAPITTYQLEEFIRDHVGMRGEILLLYQVNPRRDIRHITINGVAKTLKGGSKVQTGSELMEGRESFRKRKRTLEPPTPPETKRARYDPSPAAQRPTITGGATEAASLLVPSPAPMASSHSAQQFKVSGGSHRGITDGIASLEPGVSNQGKQNLMSTKRDTERASARATKGLHLAVGWTGMK